MTIPEKVTINTVTGNVERSGCIELSEEQEQVAIDFLLHIIGFQSPVVQKKGV